MLVNEMMDKDFIVVSPDDDLIDVSILMEKNSDSPHQWSTKKEAYWMDHFLRCDPWL